ncbi:uncharacterized protein LOC121997945 [Zingiber officinale]|nr:uncharacterized protein LOC121997945 [Zingiber officinale]
MNFLIRTAQPIIPEVSKVVEPEQNKVSQPTIKRTTTLEGLIAEEPYPGHSVGDDINSDNIGSGFMGSSMASSTFKNQVPIGDYTDVSKDNGWITIPYKELLDNWHEAADIQQMRSLDRSFVFPGEHIHILVCLSAHKREPEIITPFRVAAVMAKNGKSNPNKVKPVETNEKISSSISLNGVVSNTAGETSDQNAENNGHSSGVSSPKDDISAAENLRMEFHKQQTEDILESFRNSNFLVRIAEADEQLWSRKNTSSSMIPELVGGRSYSDGGLKSIPKSNFFSVVVDKGRFDGNTSGGVARDTARCYSLSNGDIVVYLEVNVGIKNLKDPVLEVIQFEKYRSDTSIEDHCNSLVASHNDPCRELLNWLLPLDSTLPPHLLSSPSSSSISKKPTNPATGSQIFSLGHFRSYSMPSLPQVSGSPSVGSLSNPNPSIDLEDFSHISTEKLIKSQDSGNVGLLSFRGVPLEPERFSAHCGLEGIYLPGWRWRRKLEIIQPVEIHSFAADCNTEDLLCVQIKNVSPAHIPDLIIFLDAISIVSEEASKGGSLISVPIASIETGNAHNLPNLSIRRGEQHSFILKLATIPCRDQKEDVEMIPYSRKGSAGSKTKKKSSTSDGMMVSSAANQFAILVSCRCNFTESKLFFKQVTNWQPRISRDLMISVASETNKRTGTQSFGAPQLPVKVLTLKASNLTHKDLTFTVLAPESAISPSVISLTSTPKTLKESYAAIHDYARKLGGDKSGSGLQSLSSLYNSSTQQTNTFEGGKVADSLERTSIISDVISNNSGFTHLWLQSAVPLGCIPALSSATVKLELLPLTDGIISLDTLQIAVKEKGLTFVPEHSIKIHATSSISTGIL